MAQKATAIKKDGIISSFFKAPTVELNKVYKALLTSVSEDEAKDLVTLIFTTPEKQQFFIYINNASKAYNYTDKNGKHRVFKPLEAVVDALRREFNSPDLQLAELLQLATITPTSVIKVTDDNGFVNSRIYEQVKYLFETNVTTTTASADANTEVINV